MKKILLVCSVALLIVSCKKDYSCNCTTTVSVTAAYYEFDSTLYQAASSYVDDSDTYTFKVKKKESEDKCKSYESTDTDMDTYGSYVYGGDRTTTKACTLK
jgi:hypothetical protein